ncbi:MAG: hypothetical protein D3926_12630 [Desulfobacteraceae bacterium]|nr:MAG: hypothetical protein D3926_12630 [Desulfobacteraceae bacterium]
MIERIDDLFSKTNHYHFNNWWQFHAPVQQVWNELMDYRKWPSWCGSLEKVEPLIHRDRSCNRPDLKQGNLIRTAWKGNLPYTLTFDSTIRDFDPYSFLAFDVTGDLEGSGICNFYRLQNRTRINFIWDVAPTKLWIKMSSPFARPVFIENHNMIMAELAQGFEQLIRQKYRINRAVSRKYQD